MVSGRRERIVISCVTFDVAKIVEPAAFYEATRVHLIHYGQDGIYKEFYDEVCRGIVDKLPKAEIVEHNVAVYDFIKMMSTILTIIRDEWGDRKESKDIFVNVSAGTSEYSAASLIASMMMEGTIPFNVPTDEFQVNADMVRQIYYDGDRPIGLTKSCKEPKMLSTYAIQRPDEKQVLALGVLKERLSNGMSTFAPAMIKELGSRGLMKYTVVEGRSGKPDQKSIMSYQRNFVDRWLDNGWVERVSKRELMITDNGEQILGTFLGSYSIS